jgi:hypothetical protein
MRIFAFVTDTAPVMRMMTHICEQGRTLRSLICDSDSLASPLAWKFNVRFVGLTRYSWQRGQRREVADCCRSAVSLWRSAAM